MDSLANRVRRRREELGWSQAELGFRSGMSQQGIDSIEKGEVQRPRKLLEIADALGVPQRWLLEGEGHPDPDHGFSSVPVMGFVGAGAEIEPEIEQVPEAGLYEVEIAFPLADDTVAFEVRGESMLPRYDPGDVVICWRRFRPPEQLLGREAVVRLADGRRFLKRILRGSSRKTFNLESFNARLIEDARIEWALEIHVIVPAGQWRKANGKPISNHDTADPISNQEGTT
jgi:transcriptional regulator with XRE-family HTH domain